MLRFKIIFLIFSIFLLILHPYTIYGKPAFLFCLFFLFLFFNKPILKSNLFFIKNASLLILLSIFGVLSSFINNIPQFNHFTSSVTLLILLIVFLKISTLLIELKIKESTFLKIILFILLFNCIIILLELFFNPFRIFLESFLDPLEQGTINYAEGYKFRGIASSGGAGLSITLPIISIISAYLLSIKQLNFFKFLFITFIILVTGTLIGRTGLIQTVFLNIFYLFYFKKNIIVSFRNYKSQILIFISFISMTIFLINLLLDYYNDTFGLGFTNYAFKFFLDGKEGLEEEGTVPILIKYVSVLPTSFPYFLIGYGFYGGSVFANWTDSGFARTFLSLGFPLGLFYYFLILRIFIKSLSFNKFLLIPILIILCIAELKEPLLYSGVASRSFLLISLYYYMKNTKKPIENFTYYTNS